MKLPVAILAIAHAVKADGIRHDPSAAADAGDEGVVPLPNRRPTSSAGHADDEDEAYLKTRGYADWVVASTATPGSSSSRTIGRRTKHRRTAAASNLRAGAGGGSVVAHRAAAGAADGLQPAAAHPATSGAAAAAGAGAGAGADALPGTPPGTSGAQTPPAALPSGPGGDDSGVLRAAAAETDAEAADGTRTARDLERSIAAGGAADIPPALPDLTTPDSDSDSDGPTLVYPNPNPTKDTGTDDATEADADEAASEMPAEPAKTVEPIVEDGGILTGGILSRPVEPFEVVRVQNEGILPPPLEGRSASFLTPTDDCPAGDFVDCRDGYAFVGGTKTSDSCATACGGECCIKDDSPNEDTCYKATACIEKNPTNPNCNGQRACYYVGYESDVKPVISGGSCVGKRACYYLAKGGGTVDSITNSCTAEKACYMLAYNGDAVGNIANSCTASKACFYLAEGGGTVGDIKDSCTGYRSCYKFAYDGGTVGNIDDSCNGYKACYFLAGRGFVLASNNIVVGDIANSCNNAKACYKLAQSEFAQNGVAVGNITNSCTAENACYSLAYDGTVGDITDSCLISDCCDNHCKLNVVEILGTTCDSAPAGNIVNIADAPGTCPAPSPQPSTQPSISAQPSSSFAPSQSPSSTPSAQPSSQPSTQPSVSAQPSSLPSLAPSQSPSSAPSSTPTITDPINKIKNLISDLKVLLASTTDKKEAKNIDKAIDALGEKKGAIKELEKGDGTLPNSKAADDIKKAYDKLECEDAKKEKQDPNQTLIAFCDRIKGLLDLVL